MPKANDTTFIFLALGEGRLAIPVTESVIRSFIEQDAKKLGNTF